MKKDYSSENANRRKNTNDALWIFFIFIAIFIAIIIRFAVRSDSGDSFFKLMPTSHDAYEIAKYYVRPTLRSPDVEFGDDDFQTKKNSDSVYVIKSYVKIKDVGDGNNRTNFTATLKYNGGSSRNTGNWTLVSLEEH